MSYLHFNILHPELIDMVDSNYHRRLQIELISRQCTELSVFHLFTHIPAIHRTIQATLTHEISRDIVTLTFNSAYCYSRKRLNLHKVYLDYYPTWDELYF